MLRLVCQAFVSKIDHLVMTNQFLAQKLSLFFWLEICLKRGALHTRHAISAVVEVD